MHRGRRGSAARPQPFPENPVLVAFEQVQSQQGRDLGLDTVRREYMWERSNFCHMVHKGKARIRHLEKLLGTWENQYAEEYRNSLEATRKNEATLSDLQESLRVQEDKMEVARRLSQQKFEEMVARYEAEKQISSQNQKNPEQQSEDQTTTEQLEVPKATEVLTCQKGYESYVKLTEMKIQLKQDQTQQEDKEKDHSWKIQTQKLETTCNSLEEELKKERAKNEEWEIKYKKLLDEKKDLEETNQIWKTEVERMNDRVAQMEVDLVNKEQTWRSKVKEDLCVSMKLKSREERRQVGPNEDQEAPQGHEHYSG